MNNQSDKTTHLPITETNNKAKSLYNSPTKNLLIIISILTSNQKALSLSTLSPYVLLQHKLRPLLPHMRLGVLHLQWVLRHHLPRLRLPLQ